MHRNIPRTERFGIGSKIDSLVLEILELLRKATYAKVGEKLVVLDKASIVIDSLRFFLQLLWDIHCIPQNQFISLGTEVEELGKIIGGWKRGLINKTSAIAAEERKE